MVLTKLILFPASESGCVLTEVLSRVSTFKETPSKSPLSVEDSFGLKVGTKDLGDSSLLVVCLDVPDLKPWGVRPTVVVTLRKVELWIPPGLGPNLV